MYLREDHEKASIFFIMQTVFCGFVSVILLSTYNISKFVCHGWVSIFVAGHKDTNIHGLLSLVNGGRESLYTEGRF